MSVFETEDASSNLATEIYRLTKVENKKAYFTVLCKTLENKLTPLKIMSALATLRDFGIVESEYGETEPNIVSRLYRISDESIETIKSVYEEYCK